MAYLIDGNNFLGFSFPGEPREAENKRTLIRRLLAFQRQTRSKIILIFDGRPVEDLAEIGSQKNKFEIINPAEGETADSVIKDILSRQTDLRKLFVVSSDRDIKTFAAAKGARPITNEEFNAELRKVLKVRKEAREMEKHVRRPSSLEVRLWEDVFKGKK